MYRSLNDPRDPWAWRDSWTGETRNSYDDLWIWITLIVGLLFIAFLLLVPLMIHKYCRSACPCQNLCRSFDRFLRVLHAMGRERRAFKRRVVPPATSIKSFENPVFASTVYPSTYANYAQDWPPTQYRQRLERHPRVYKSMRGRRLELGEPRHVEDGRRCHSLPARKRLDVNGRVRRMRLR